MRNVKLTGVRIQKQFEKEGKTLMVNVIACTGCFKLLNDPFLWCEDPLGMDQWQNEASGDSC